VFSRKGISPIPLAGCLGTLLQAPVLIALYSAVRRVATVGGRFGWIRDISQPDVLITIIVGGLTALGTMITSDASAPSRTLMMLLPTVITMIVLSKMAAGVALYWGMSSAFNVAQAIIVKRYGT
jgi:YidC/Oxa1 family membrane protein insertase